MSKKNNKKTNVMRLLDQAKISYKSYDYETTKETCGEKVADLIQVPPNQVFKTLVTVSAGGKYYIFDIPVNRELDLKKAAQAVNEKSIQMIPAKDLLPLTGYVHGGCSPLGMKKSFPTTFDCSAKNFNTIVFSAGKIGHQVAVRLEDVKNILDFDFADLCQH